MSTNIDKKTKKVIAEIHEKLNRIESYIMWLITADQRFRVGQRVELSKRAIRARILPSTQTDIRGTVKALEGFSVRVQLDNRKHPRSYHHAFFNPVSGSKLF